MTELPDNQKAATARQRLELTDAEQRDLRTAAATHGYRSLHRFVRAVLLTVAHNPDLLQAVMERARTDRE